MLDFITGVIGGILYPLFSIIFVIIDTLQNLFFSLAGVGDVKVTGGGTGFFAGTITAGNSGTENDTGLIFYLLNTPLVKNMLISIMVLGLFLLIIFTVMAFIKNAYSAKQKGWKEIIGNSIKGLANFIFLPVVCLLGIWAGNILLNAINGATSSGGSELMSRKLFIASAYNANSYRLGTINDKGRCVHIYKVCYGNSADTSWIEDNRSGDYYAEIVDQCYASGNLSIYEWGTVEMGYSLYQVNYLMLIVGGVFMMYVLVSLAYGMVKRMFYLTILFIISPALCAMYPLDEGKAVGAWKDDFKKNTISAYAAVAGMNLFFSVLPIVDNINFMPWSSMAGDSIIDSIIQLLIMVAGLFVVKDLISTIASYIGGGNAYADGTSLRSTAKTTIKDKAKTAAKKTGAFIGAAKNISHVTHLDRLPGFINRQKAGVDKETWSKMTAEEKSSALQSAKEEALATKRDKKAFESAKENTLFRPAKFKDKKWEDLTDDEKKSIRNKRATAGHYASAEDMIKKEHESKLSSRVGRGIGKVGSGIGKAASWVAGASGTRLFLEESGIGEIIDEGKKAYTSKVKAQSKRDKVETEGEAGEIKAKEKAEKALAKADSGVYITGMTSEVLTAMGDKISEAAFKTSKKTLDFESLGLGKDASLADLRAVDTSLKSAGRGISNIEGAAAAENTELAGKFIKSMEEKLLDMDTSGNGKLADAVSNALGKISDFDKSDDKSAAKIQELANALKQSFAAMNAASEKNAKEMVKAIEEQRKEVVKAVKEADKS